VPHWGHRAGGWRGRCSSKAVYEISPIDPVTFVSVTVLFAVVAATAAFMPARRAAIANPLRALRAE
jgi:ABC-type lipoprotein release transport system permease subunit